MSFISRYVKLLSKITDAPEEFQEAAALFSLSTVVRRGFVFQSIPETSIFRSDQTKDLGKPLNLWIILLGKSRITRKTTGVIHHVEDLIKEVLGELPFLSKAFTPEFMVKEMSEKTSGDETNCIWINDEIAGFFQKLRKRDSYMTSADAVLSTIYDGNTYSTGTIGREHEIVLNPYLTLLLSSTNYLPTFFDELHIRLGFLNRFIYVIGERKERKPLRITPLVESEKREVGYIKEFLGALAQRDSATIMVMSADAKQVYDSFEEKVEKLIETEKLGIKEGYCGQLPNLAVRLSCLYRLSRMIPEKIKDFSDPVLIVERQDIERAISYSRKVWSWFKKVIEMMQAGSGRTVKLGELVESAILRILEDGEAKYYKVIVQSIERMGISGCQATVYTKLKKLKRQGRIISPKRGYFQIVKRKESD